MTLHRGTATVVGVLFIIGTATGIAAALLSLPVLSAPDYLTQLAAQETLITLCALLVFIMGVACAGIGMALYPVLKPYHEGWALGVAGFRIMEGVLDIVGVVGLLSLLVLSRDYVAAGAPAAPHYHTLAALLKAGRDWVNTVAALWTWCLGAQIYNVIFFQYRLDPRWLSAWGFLGCSSAIVASLLVMFGLIPPMSTLQVGLNFAILVQEMVLAVWLIAKGFDPAAAARLATRAVSTPEKRDLNPAPALTDTGTPQPHAAH